MAVFCTAALFDLSGFSQTVPPDAPVPPPATTPDLSEKPLPDIPALMRDVEAHQRQFEAIERNYLYHRVDTERDVDSHGQLKKTTVKEYDVYWINGVRVNRLTSKDGKQLNPDDLAKENDRLEKSAARSREKRDQSDSEGKQTDSRGREEVSVSRILELGVFTNPRRVLLNGRSMIAVDYTGDPKAKTRNRAEDVIRDIQGTVWIDEQDHVLARSEGHFMNAFKIGMGLVVNIQKDTKFTMQQTKVNGEVWLPAKLEGQGEARILLFANFNGSGEIDYSGYRRFKTTSKIVPIEPGAETPAPQTPNAPSQP